MPHNSAYAIQTDRRAKKLMQIVALLTRHLFRSEERANDAHLRKTVAQIQTVQRHVFRQIRFRFLERHGQIEGSRLAQLTVDKLFGRANSRHGDDGLSVEQFATEIAIENQTIREAAFICLLAMLELQSADNHAAARRRIADTIHWLQQFGEIPLRASEPNALALISESLTLPTREH